ncbi:EboA domain-containing protein [Gilvimarinus xylanilyticus]|uniref:EboA domain-containing protein n=1 Tax=Gilvimarinus xylanilyticus TaxID=2944139 RepID=A0A9X2KTP3_9GAMM|nr:EboA domain-containing protein [Gilvimarinus xylanilyticus]MCP8900101.1 EboA domain-containing protein [Gilvimarinus xylanilyticus]
MTQTPETLLESLLRPRLEDKALAFWDKAKAELNTGCNTSRFAALIALASRHSKRRGLALSGADQAAISAEIPGLTLRDWNLLELLRVALICSRNDLNEDSFAADFEAQFTHADEGETCALYRALAFLPAGERFAWRAGEGCRTNMLSVFRAIALDSPYPAKHFDATAWHQLVMKALFLELPVWRLVGLDDRRSAELTRMALDYAEERGSAGRDLPLGLWLCLDDHDPDRVDRLAHTHWPGADTRKRQAMVLGLARAGQLATLQAWADGPVAPEIVEVIKQAQNGQTTQTHFARLVAEQSEIEP